MPERVMTEAERVATLVRQGMHEDFIGHTVYRHRPPPQPKPRKPRGENGGR
jgi:hypothetical protein